MTGSSLPPEQSLQSTQTLTLVIEASTAAGSVAVFHGDTLLGRETAAMGVSREDALFPAVLAVLEKAGLSIAASAQPGALREIVCGGGPGSFTSLRIAAALAKGLAHATGAQLFSVPSLLFSAAAHGIPGRYLVHSDALRGERYVLRVRIDETHVVHADGLVERVDLAVLHDVAADRSLLEVVGGSPVSAGIAVAPDAAQLPRLGDWRTLGVVDLAGWEPAYGRLAEAQVKWEATNARALPTA